LLLLNVECNLCGEQRINDSVDNDVDDDNYWYEGEYELAEDGDGKTKVRRVKNNDNDGLCE
jgi:hypothetical protein